LIVLNSVIFVVMLSRIIIPRYPRNRQIRLEINARANQNNVVSKSSEPIAIFHHKRKVCANQRNISVKSQIEGINTLQRRIATNLFGEVDYVTGKNCITI